MNKKIMSMVLTAAMLLSGTAVGSFTTQAKTIDDNSVSAQNVVSSVGSGDQGPQDSVQGSAVLHCFDWSYNTIKANLAAIKAAGYTAVQTSPVQPAKDYKASWTDQDGQWWKLYQPIDIKIADAGQTWLGSKAELKALCDEAEKYGIKVIADIVVNHMANITDDYGNSANNRSALIPAELRNNNSYWHVNNTWADDNSRWNMTQGSIGQPDLNTGNSYIQQRVKDLLIDCINQGVDGFRFDAAKHIELPTDSGCASNFWPTVINGSQSSTSNDIYYYGEILNGAGTAITNYTKYMSITDTYSGDLSLVSANSKNASGLANSNYSKGAGDSKSVIWVESHDTYMGDSGSAGLKNTKSVSSSTVVKAWAIVGSRANSTALYFARPSATMGAASTDTSWKSTAVAEVNKFKNYFDGESEYLSSSGDVAYNERGTSGVVISKLSGGGSVSLPAKKMTAGTYKDQVSGSTFTVANGKITGTVGSSGVAVVYNAKPAGPSASVTPGSTSYKTDTYTLTLKYSNATSGQYSIDNGAYTSFTNGQTITIGKGAAYGTVTKVNVKASNASTTSDVATYTYTKVDPAQGQYVYFDNSSYKWSNVYAYIYAPVGEEVVENAKWPGVKMTMDSSGYYSIEVPENLSNGSVIFTESDSATTNRYPADGEEGMQLSGKSMLFGANHSWKEFSHQPATTAPKTTAPVTTAPKTTAPVTTIAPATTTPIGSLLMGDVNFDGDVTIDDATEIQRHLADIIKLSDKAVLAADTNDDGFVDIIDVTTIQYYLVGNTAKAGICGKYTGEPTTTAPSTTVAHTTAPATTAPVTTVPTTTKPVVTNTYTIKFTNNYNWSKVYCYYWADNDTTLSAWPGKEMTYESTNDFGQGIYTITVPSSATHIIFNNGDNGQQTVDVDVKGSANYYISGGSGTTCTVETWTESGGTTQPTTQPTTSPSTNTYTIKLTNNYNWSKVYCYYWADNDTTLSSWPGKEMTYESTNDFGQGIYTITVPSSVTHIIFNNGNNGQQTVDIDIKGSANYYISGGSGTTCEVATW